jgi:methyl-accepting chemotaxis protein
MISPRSEASIENLARWIDRVAAARDCSLPPPENGPRARAILHLLGSLSDEFRDYRAVVAGADEAARRNGEALGGIVRSATDQGDLVRTAAGAVTEASGGAGHVADAAVELQRFAVEAAGAADGAAEGLSEIRGALTGLAGGLLAGRGPIEEMNASTRGVTTFLTALGRLSRQAQLLSVNAAIESAHLAEAGARFALVALEVRKLSVSTREASSDVGRIVNELRSSTERVGSAVDGAEAATGAAASDIALASATLARTQSTIGDFEETIDEIASVAGQQRSALDTVAAGIHDIVRHAEEAAAESRRASEIDVNALLSHARAVAGGWNELRDIPPPPDDDEPFVVWVARLGASADRSIDTSDPTIAALGPSLLTLLSTADADAFAILSDIKDISSAVTANGFAWRTISLALAAVREEIGAVRIAIGEAVSAARTAADRATAMRAIVDSMQRAYDEALASLDGALGRIAGISKGVGEIDGLVDAMTGAAARASEILALIDTLSSETDLLSLNAAIEAAHAGEAGLAFGVIAEEIRTLALTTHASTQSVGELVERIVGISDTMRGSTGVVAGSTRDVTASADRVRGAIAALRESFAATMQRALDVFETAQLQARALEGVLDIVARSATAVDFDASSATDRRRLELATVGARMHAVAARRPRGLAVETVRAFAGTLAVEIEQIVEAQLDRGALREEDLFDFRYTELAGPEIARIARLFDVRRVPPAGFSPPKYGTPWDAAIDTAVIDLFERRFDELAAYEALTFGLFDLNAFVWAHPRRLIRDWTGDPALDVRGNRIKRLFEDEYSMRVARWGLGPNAPQVGLRASYRGMRDAGCTLEQAGERPWGAYVYSFDIGTVFNELAIAIFFRGKRHSTLRIAYGARFI